MIAGVALFVAAIFTSPIVCAGRAAGRVRVDAGTRTVQARLALAALVGGACGVLFVALNAVTQGGFFFNIVTANVNEWETERLGWNLNRFTGTAMILCLFGLLSMTLGGRRNPSATEHTLSDRRVCVVHHRQGRLERELHARTVRGARLDYGRGRCMAARRNHRGHRRGTGRWHQSQATRSRPRHWCA